MSTSNGHSSTGMKIPKYQELIGDTPLIDITSICGELKRDVKVYAKCEFINPGFSTKDRVVRHIFNKGEKEGKLKPGSTVVSASSGNTGASVAMLAAMRGYKAVITTSPKCSKEKMDAIRAYGAKLLVSASGLSDSDPNSYANMANRLAKENGWFDVDQYENLDNPESHFLTTGAEIWEQTGGKVTHFVAAGSTGGTISGVSKYLKSKNPEVRCTLVDPEGSVFHDYFKTGKFSTKPKTLVEGIGKDHLPGCIDFKVIDEVMKVTDDEAFGMCRKLAKKEGLMVGGSSGANSFAAATLANSLEEPAVIVTVLVDMGVKYLSKIFNNEWLEANKIQLEKDAI